MLRVYEVIKTKCFVVVPYCYLFLLSVFILWFTYYVSDIFQLSLGSWMTTCLGKSCSFGLPSVPFVNCCQFIYLVLSFLVLWEDMVLIVSVPDHCLFFYFENDPIFTNLLRRITTTITTVNTARTTTPAPTPPPITRKSEPLSAVLWASRNK